MLRRVVLPSYFYYSDMNVAGEKKDRCCKMDNYLLKLHLKYLIIPYPTPNTIIHIGQVCSYSPDNLGICHPPTGHNAVFD